MPERKMSKKSLENLTISNRESNRLTRESLEISLLQLLEKKELAKITISELVNRAGVSRASFYRNYNSKEEILESFSARLCIILWKKWLSSILRRSFTKYGLLCLKRHRRKRISLFSC